VRWNMSKRFWPIGRTVFPLLWKTIGMCNPFGTIWQPLKKTFVTFDWTNADEEQRTELAQSRMKELQKTEPKAVGWFWIGKSKS
jgi:hypothetical protein